MTISGIWTRNKEGWRLRRPHGFPDEATLHDLIEETPEMLPLAGSPALLILGREVPLGSGYADLLGVEASGQPVIIEIKLAKAAAAKRAVVAQILAYAAHLHGTTREQLENLLGAPVENAARSAQHQTVDPDEFAAAFDKHLQEGRFRLVFVLDRVPAELMTLVAYLEHLTNKLVIDLVAVGSFEVDGTSILLPQRVTPERHEVTVTKKPKGKSGALFPGSERFEKSIGQAPEDSRALLHRLVRWARRIEEEGYVQLTTTEGKGAKRFTLLPRLVGENAGLVTIWNEGGAYLQFWRSMFEKKAPDFIDQIESLAGIPIGQGNTTRNISEELLAVLTQAYEHAAR